MTQTLSLLAPGTYHVDPSVSVARFRVKHLPMQTVRGTFGPVTGTVDLDESGRLVARGAVRADSFDSGSHERDVSLGRFLSDDGVAPEIVVEVDTLVDFAMDGTLQVRGAIAPVTFHVEPQGARRLHVHFSVDRRSVGVQWPMPADKAVGRVVDVELELELRHTD